MKVPLLRSTTEVERARAVWQYRGQSRPTFATEPKQGETSVWDFPRPPVIEDVTGTMSVRLGAQLLASTERGKRVLEPAGAPTYYFPPGDVIAPLSVTGARSICEWKGLAEALSLRERANVGWRYVEMFEEFQSIHRWVAFYPARVDCYIDGARMEAQPGGFYGGGVSGDLVGPIKGEPGSSQW